MSLTIDEIAALDIDDERIENNLENANLDEIALEYSQKERATKVAVVSTYADAPSYTVEITREGQSPRALWETSEAQAAFRFAIKVCKTNDAQLVYF